MGTKWLTGVGVLALGVAAQQSPPASTQKPQQPQPPPVFRSGAELVRVDVTVLNRDGKPVTTLTADDFVVEEDGVPQEIQTFRFQRLEGALGPDDDPYLTIPPRDLSRSEFARDDIRLFLVFWDEYHINPDPAGRMIREELMSFLQTQLSPSDLVGIMDLWTPMSDLWFSRDRYKLVDQARALRGRLGVLYPPRNQAEENQLFSRHGVRNVREQVALTALKSAIVHLGALRESRKTILYIGREFGLGRDTTQFAQEIIQTANSHNVAIYSINPEGLQVGRSNFRTGILSIIAHNTGGESLVTNAPAVAFGRVMTQSAASYLLGYSPAPLRHDGKFHKITVKVKGGGLQLRFRNGYWAPTPGAMAAAKEATAAAAVPAPIEAAFSELVRLGRRESDEAAYEPRTIFSPDPPPFALALDPPSVWRIQRPSDMKEVRGDAPPPPHPGREFERTERLLIRVTATGELAPRAELSIGLIDRKGKRLTDLPFSGTGGRWLVDLPLQSIARGDYLLAVEAVHGTARSTAYLPIRIQ